MLHIVVDFDSKIEIGNDIIISIKKKSGKKIWLSIEAPKDKPIKYHKKEKQHDSTADNCSG